MTGACVAAARTMCLTDSQRHRQLLHCIVRLGREQFDDLVMLHLDTGIPLYPPTFRGIVTSLFVVSRIHCQGCACAFLTVAKPWRVGDPYRGAGDRNCRAGRRPQFCHRGMC